MGFSWPSRCRLKRRSDFLVVQRTGRKRSTRDLIVRYRSSDKAGFRVGFTVSKRVGNAVIRNCVKRWLREAVRHERVGLSNVDIVVIARPSAKQAGLTSLSEQIHQVFQQLVAR